MVDATKKIAFRLINDLNNCFESLNFEVYHEKSVHVFPVLIIYVYSCERTAYEDNLYIEIYPSFLSDRPINRRKTFWKAQKKTDIFSGTRCGP